MGYSYIIAGILSAVLLCFYLIIKKFREPDLKILLLIPVLVFGFALYLAGYLPALIAGGTAEPVSLGAVMSGVARALASTIQMLGGENGYEVIAQNGGYFSTYGYMIPFWVTHFVAVLVTILAAVTVFGRTLASKFRQLRHYAADTYIIYGVNSKSLCLGRNILNEDCGESRAKRFVVFIDENADQASREQIGRMGAVLLGEPMFSCDRLNLKALVKAGLTGRRKNIYLFAFTGSAVLNVSIANGIWDTAAENGVSGERLKGIYVYADTAAIALEREAKNHNFSYFCEAELAARLLVGAYPLYKRLAFDPASGLAEDGNGKPVITVVILGFGPTGRHVLRQTLMNGQFEGCAFEAAIIDTQADGAAGAFMKKYPALFDREASGDISISFHNTSAGSLGTYEILDALLEKNGRLDYVISCLGGDDLNFEVINDLRSYLIKNPALREKMPVFAAHIADKKYQRSGGEEVGKITVFGDDDALLTHRLVVNEELDALAKAVDHAAYGGTDWPALPLHEKNSNRAAASYIGAYLYMMGLELVSCVQEQDLREQGIPYESLTSEQFGALLKRSGTLLENLGRTEHRRWNVFHFASGWERRPLGEVGSYAGRKDAKNKTHACLVDWDGLSGVRDHIVAVSGKAGIGEKQLEDIRTSCEFEAFDKNNISKLFDIITAYNSRVHEDSRLHIIRRI